MRSIAWLHTLVLEQCICMVLIRDEGEPENKDELAEDGRVKWLKVSVGEDNKPYWTTGEFSSSST